MAIIRWVVGGIFLALCAYITIVQLVYVVAVLLKKTSKHSSLAPAFIFGLVGLLLLPDPITIQRWFWVPLVLDPFVYMLIFGLPITIMRNLKGKQGRD
jgi:hypothetical protein